LKSREALYSFQFNIRIISDRIVDIESRWNEVEDTGASFPTYVIGEERVCNESVVGVHQSCREKSPEDKRTKGFTGTMGTYLELNKAIYIRGCWD
jgi:hypothetical protein